MSYHVEVRPTENGEYTAECTDFTGCRVRGSSEEEALAGMRDAIRFYVERCPCEQVADEEIDLDVKRR